MALSTHEILRRLEQNAPVIRRYGVRSLGLFGSGARGAAREDSDLDFVVEFETKSFDAYMDLKAFLERLFGCPVDLVLREAIKPRLRETILKEALHPRDFRVHLEDILGAIGKIKRYTTGLSKEGFAGDDKTLDAVVRNLEVIGEAVKQLPTDLRSQEPGIDWQKIAGLRDILIHRYFGSWRSRCSRTAALWRSVMPRAAAI